MLKRLLIFFSLASILLGCTNTEKIKLKRIGLLVPETVSDQVWGTKGYKGMLKIQSAYNADVYYREGMTTKTAVAEAVKEFDQKGVQLIFGHGKEYAEFFNEIGLVYPHIHFVSFNGEARLKNTTSLTFDSHAMGFFGGMTAGHATKTNQVGMIAAERWQPEVRGFIDGVAFENASATVYVVYTGDWDDCQKALELLDTLNQYNVDVVYPAGDGYTVPVIEQLKANGLYAIGYVSDQSDLGGATVLTSTVQDVDKLYGLVAEKYSKGKLQSGNVHVGFQEGVLSIGKYSPNIKVNFIEKVNHYLEAYIKDGKLPNAIN